MNPIFLVDQPNPTEQNWTACPTVWTADCRCSQRI